MSEGLVTLSARLLLPFARVCGSDPRVLRVLAAHKVDLVQLAQPEARIPHARVMALLRDIVRELNDPQLGLKAGAGVVHGDLDVFGETVSSQLTLRAAGDVAERYIRLLHSGAELNVAREGATGVWRYRTHDGLEEPTAVHDFIVACLTRFSYLCAPGERRQLAVNFAHGDRTNLEEYRRLFCCPIWFDMPYTGVIFPAERLDIPLANPPLTLSEGFEARARARLADVDEESDRFAELVRKTLVASIESGDTSMTSVARRIGVSIATLRRKLANESTSHSAILEDIRKRLALRFVERNDMSATKIALFLGFADSSAFHRAFRRWTGRTPQEHRRTVKG